MKHINNSVAFKNKTILLISPQIWCDMQVSKHHYAKELAAKGNKVYFLNPLRKGWGYTIEKIEGNDNLYLITFSLSIAYRLHFRWLFDLFMKLVFKYITTKHKLKFDIIWNFSHALLTDYKVFKTNINIFQPMDATNYKYEYKLARNSDIIVSVSNEILNQYTNISTPKFLINHGLGKDFEEYANARKLNLTPAKKTSGLKIGFVGNLRFGGLDFKSYTTIIEDHPNCEFIFWGSYSISNSPLGAFTGKEIDDFVEFLLSRPNVKLRGVVPPAVLSKEIQDIDIFTAFYDENLHLNRSANSHKILEYLSTGKVIVANFISMYSGKNELIRMPFSGENHKIPELFSETANNIEFYNSEVKMLTRINYALDHTYRKQIEKIETEVNKIILSN